MHNCLETREYQGKHFPKFVNEIVNLKPGKIFFGGSSLIHDLFFPRENWGKTDYDIWCSSSESELIKEYFKPYHKIINDFVTQDCNIKQVQRYKINNQRIQIIFVQNITKVFLKKNFSFNTVFYDGNKIYYFRTTENDVKNKQGVYLYHPLLNSDYSTKRELNYQTQKYLKRGFKIKNLCPKCNKPRVLSLEHTFVCTFKNELSSYIGLLNRTFIKSLNQMEEVDKIKTYLQNELEKNNPYSYGFILMFNNFLEKVSFNPNKIYQDMSYLELILINLGKLGLTELFIEIYSFYQKKYDNKKFEKRILNLVCDENNIHLARYLSLLNPKISLNIRGDFIFSYEIKNIFTCFLEKNDIKVLSSGIKDSEIFNKDEECFICQKNKNEITLQCKHSFCGTCLSQFYQLKEKKKEQLQCPMCRSDVELLE